MYMPWVSENLINRKLPVSELQEAERGSSPRDITDGRKMGVLVIVCGVGGLAWDA